ncbi:sensory histidine kinase DcuS [Clostridium homopropionicum DSM 5847]|uniref:Sensory histidine kinase DcuS n=1 Tax=Clostridium homopropionicum DSM 5847 TaxID=1121318 RepID=A0A0L6ZBC7_9CLOT|nr:GHKL domain-containing protein [Clostridium homopropionicum]KOA20279.1 sensory histidine kinase DcuS [Clostridium homopropionicum DSM 5847]SFG80051.1 two-component system, AgrA family, sensor histidine kinase AgrC [Clostridium homopropionicum]
MFDIIMNILNVLTLSFNVSIIASNISGIKATIKHIFITTITIFIPSYWLFIFKMNNLLVPLSVIIIFLLYCSILKNKYSALLISVFTQVIFALSDAIVGIVFVVILKIDYSLITNNIVIALMLSFAIISVAYIISKSFNVFIRKQSFISLSRFIKKDASIFAFSLTVVLISIYLYTRIFKYWSQSPSITFYMSNLLLIVSFFIFLTLIIYLNYKNIKKDLENIHKEADLNQLKEYTEMLEAVSSDLRSFKHDYVNIIQIIGDYLDSKKIDELDAFYRNELMPESKKILAKNRSFILLQHIKIIPLKGLISSKVVIAQSKGINVRLEISEDIHELSINLIDICRIVGVLFDNAIEAAEVCNDKFIEFLIYRDENSTVFILSNSCSEDVPPIYKIYEKNFSTKGSQRGIGLKSVRNIINEKYKNVTLTTHIENSVFTQELIVNLPYTKI